VGVRSGCVCRLTAVEGSAMREWAADGEDDTEGHGCRKDSSHGGDDCLDGVLVVGRFSDEPEEHVDHVNDEDRSIEVKAITKHELPIAKLLNAEGLDAPRKSEGEGRREEDRGEEPVDTDELPIVELRSCNATLPRVERRGREFKGHGAVETAHDGHCSDLKTEEDIKGDLDGLIPGVDGRNADGMDE